jgi:hypothetical protein
MTDYNEWWGETGYNPSGDEDDDGDCIPNDVEIALGLNPDGDTDGKEPNDFEDRAYAAEATWQAGSANHQDWSVNGAQWHKGDN